MPLILLASFVGIGLGAGAFRLADETGDAVKYALPLAALAAVGFLVFKR